MITLVMSSAAEFKTKKRIIQDQGECWDHCQKPNGCVWRSSTDEYLCVRPTHDGSFPYYGTEYECENSCHGARKKCLYTYSYFWECADV